MIARAAGLAADGIDVQFHLFQAEIFQKGIGERNGLRIGLRPGCAVQFAPELVEFAQTARLRTLIAECRDEVVRLEGKHAARKPVLDECARDARRPLGAQGHRPAALVEECVHLLVDDVRRVAHAARKELRVLEHGRADLTERIGLRRFARPGFKILP